MKKKLLIASLYFVFVSSIACAASDGTHGQAARTQSKILGKTIELGKTAIQVGNSVLDEDGWFGTVNTIFDDGRAIVSYGLLGRKIKRISLLSKMTNEVRDFKRGVRVIDEKNSIGTIEALFEDGRARVTYGLLNERRRTLHVSNLTLEKKRK